MIRDLATSACTLHRYDMMKSALFIIHSMPLIVLVHSAPQPASELCVAFESRYHVERGCECVVYESNGRSRGTFSSLRYPRALPANLSCVLYTLIGDLDERVHLSFTTFDLPPPNGRGANRSCTDFVRLYLNLERAEVNDAPTYELCGDLSLVGLQGSRSEGQRNYFSSRRSAIVELHTSSVQTKHTGFLAAYEFIEKAQFDTLGGTRRPHSDCTYDFYSSSRGTKSGRFFSPLYPQNYPPLAACHYFFYGAQGERVRVTLLHLELDGTHDRCASRADVITVRDGVDVTSPVVSYHCGAASSPQDVLSSGENASLEFLSDASTERQGFAATFQFIPAGGATSGGQRGAAGGGRVGGGGGGAQGGYSTTARGGMQWSTSVGPVMLKHAEMSRLRLLDASAVMVNVQETSAGHSEAAHTEGGCSQELRSADKKSGTVTSRGYPRPYPPRDTCRYAFRGQDHERVRLTFNVLDLARVLDLDNRTASDEGQRCDELDSLTVTAYVNDRPMDIAVYCGGDRGALSPLLSSDPRLDLLFISRAPPTASASVATGFEASFEFISDFGISSGEQDTFNGCSFSYSSQTAQNGSFVSPNHPGLYPRSTDCHYLLYGRKGERVLLAFTHFDIDGMLPGCLEQTHSDYVELSNFNVALTDRKLSRLCGVRGDTGPLPAGALTAESLPVVTFLAGMRPVWDAVWVSDTNFFRVTFHSNRVYDATGFQALYFFRADEEPLHHVARASQLPSSSPLSPHAPPHSRVWRALLLATLAVLLTLDWHLLCARTE